MLSDDQEGLVETYRGHLAGAAYLGGQWQYGLLPFCSFGCAGYWCVDCLADDHHIWFSDHCVAEFRYFGVRDFLEMWLDGVDERDALYRPAKKGRRCIK